MVQEDFKRRLTNILSADIVGYSRLMEDNNESFLLMILNVFQGEQSYI